MSNDVILHTYRIPEWKVEFLAPMLSEVGSTPQTEHNFTLIWAYLISLRQAIPPLATLIFVVGCHLQDPSPFGVFSAMNNWSFYPWSHFSWVHGNIRLRVFSWIFLRTGRFRIERISFGRIDLMVKITACF